MSKEELIKVLQEKVKPLIDLPECLDDNYKVTTLTKELRDTVYKEQNGLCWICKCKTTVPNTHHIKPDGPATRENLVMLCNTCHIWLHGLLKKYLGYRGAMRGGW